MFDWNDLKCFLAVARHGSTIAAGKALKTSQSTVQRRLAALERRIGRKLVAREAAGYRLTDDGRRLLPHAERVEAAAHDFERQVAGAAHDWEARSASPVPSRSSIASPSPSFSTASMRCIPACASSS